MAVTEVAAMIDKEAQQNESDQRNDFENDAGR